MYVLLFLVLTAPSIFCKEQMCGADSGKTAGDVGIVIVGSVLEPDRGTEERIRDWARIIKIDEFKN